jgi:hypothetical protein
MRDLACYRAKLPLWQPRVPSAAQDRWRHCHIPAHVQTRTAHQQNAHYMKWRLAGVQLPEKTIGQQPE